MEQVVTIFTGVILFLAILMNFSAERDKRKRRRLIRWINNRGVMLGRPPKNGVNEKMYVNKKEIIMHNSGTPLSEKIGFIQFNRIRPQEKLAGKGFAI